MAAYRQGSSGEGVRQLQQQLKNHGFYSGAIDGQYGPQTAAAVREFQKARGLAVDGVAGPRTLGALNLPGGNAAAAPPAAGAVDTDVANRLRGRYPQMAWALNEPSLAPVIAKMDEYSETEFRSALYNSEFFKNNAETIRQWEALRQTDPSTYKQRIGQKAASLRNTAALMGHDVSNQPWVDALAENSIKFGWTEEQTQDQLVAQIGPWQGQADQAGAVYAYKNQVIAEAEQWGVPMSDAAAWEWSKKILSGEMSAEDMTPYFQEYAKSLYPALSAAIDRGVTVRQYVDPYLQIAVQELGINPSEISLLDPKWNRSISQINAQTKDRVPMTLDEWTRTIRKDPTYGFDHTVKAQTQAAEFQEALMSELGILA